MSSDAYAVDETPARRLARYVKARRLELKLTHAQVNNKGGPSAPTMQKVEHARAEAMLDATVVALEGALEWTAGSVRAIQDGGEPTIKGFVMEHGVDSSGQAVTVTVDLGVQLSDTEKRELMAAAEAEILKRWREIRTGEG